MTETLQKESAMKIYEIGYLLTSSVPPEKVTNVVASLKNVLSKKGANIVTEEAPTLIELAYIMTKKIGTAHQRFDQGYFGWFKFELSASEIEEVKKTFEMNPDMLRMLVMTTVKENTYLGQKAPVVEGVEGAVPTEGGPSTETLPLADLDVKAAAPVSVEDMDKSIDEMVKGA